MSADHRFPKNEKLKGLTAVRSLFTGGKSHFAYPFNLIYIIEPHTADPGTAPVSFAVSVPRKKVRSAVKRNLLKRRTREAYRLQKADLLHTATNSGQKISLMFIYIEKEVKAYPVIQKAVKKHLQFLINEVAD